MRALGPDVKRRSGLTIIVLASSYFLVFGPPNAAAQQTGESDRPDVVQVWSAEVKSSIEKRRTDAERALQLVERFRDGSAKTGNREELRIAVWPNSYMNILQVHAKSLGLITAYEAASASKPSAADYGSQAHWYEKAAADLRGERLELAILCILEAEGLPSELLAVAWVESGFNPFAESPKGARGLWQLMPETARRFGLDPDARFDERIDPARSTGAAVRYLKELYERFGDWPLALAAYNAGEGRIQKALTVSPKSDFWTLAELRLIPEETRQYVPSVLAAARQLRRQSQVSERGSYLGVAK